MRMMLALLTIAMALPAAAQAPPAEAGDPLAGREVARTWCANCHVVEENPARATADSVPTFPSIADRRTTTADGLRAFLTTQHGRMPNLALSRGDIENTIAYILTLKAK
jgi:mono/diheme cytochrome c family protein